jgi:hypothetical protein
MSNQDRAARGEAFGVAGGLSDAEAAARLSDEGPNELPTGRRPSLLELARRAL